ncbi:PVC-type heme-binding CxxCH protein [Maribacter sp. HTCC2170]|uniref:PVC-type heme-binding CxxCH protein n=1 Tax=Maribacter sp. (strain HTCC2170 / KCCM 42371) TaxID=313603 RepID=UPI00006B1A64|nr:PVC-type heme-binding CxxCH protein [Maribacter sp. HTCC2170]EAR00776.1 probable secreted glycosyl hydrolase [Maribacter sp. HTCC2170]
MKKSIIRLSSIIVVLAIVISCSGKKEKLPELTYSGEEPRIQNPLSPEDSQKHIQVPEGFEVELFAAEPNIINPIAFTWDERGRLWVVQSQDYPHGLSNDVGGDRITICEDTNRDGKADKFIDYATEQSLSTGITKVKGGIIVAQAPNMVFLEDTDGDDKMDKSTVLFDGFGIWDTHAGPSSLRYGIDNHIWGSVGYSGFENKFGDNAVNFKMGVYRFAKDGSYFEPVGQFNNNTWGLGFNESFEIFGSTANNNHCCYVGIPLKHYDYLDKRPKWALNADFIQGHYEIAPADTIPLQQVDVRGGYTAAAGANFYTARNYPKTYQNQMYVNEPTGHLVHLSRIIKDGAGYKEEDGGNIFASTDAWTAPVFSETGPDGNLWVADWYNPVIQHNPDKRGMDNQIWNDDKGEGNAHLNEHRDKGHGRIYVIKHEDGDDSDIEALDAENDKDLIEALQSENMFWRTTAQRLIVEEIKIDLIPDLVALVRNESNLDESGLNAGALHALWALDGLNALTVNDQAKTAAINALKNESYAVKRAALTLLPESIEGSQKLAESGLLNDSDMAMRLAAILRAGELPETNGLYKQIEEAAKNPENSSDRWLQAAIKVYYQELNYSTVDPKMVVLLMPSAEEQKTIWSYTQAKPSDDWVNSDFNDSSWENGPSTFGSKNTPEVKTAWTTSDIWMRREFVLNEEISEPVLKIKHDDNYAIYVNGQLLIEEEGVSNPYKYIKLDTEKGKLFKKGKNVIAVYCHDSGGDRYIDVGIGMAGKIEADVVFNLKTVNQKMAFDKTILKATAGQTVEIVLNNTDQMPHNLVVIKDGSLETFGERVDMFLKDPEAAKVGYVPNSRYVLGATEMLEPGEIGSIVVQLPDKPGRYPFVCTFPGHWRLMQGVIIVEAPGTFLSEDPDAFKIAMMGGGGSHDFLKFFGIMDGKVLSEEGKTTVKYTENSRQLGENIKDSDALFICNNKPIDDETRASIFKRVDEGMNMLIYHPSTWYNWTDWPEYNKQLVGGGSESHEKLQEFEVRVLRPNHPIMNGVPSKFRITDELYRWKKDADAVEVEVLAIGKGLESGEEFPVVWVVKHEKAKIVGNTLGHDERAHDLRAYKTLLKNSLDWIKK